jgi:hypothetical protein
VPVTTQTFSKGTFPGTVILGRPETDSITLSILTAVNADFYIQYGQTSGKYDKQTSSSTLQKDQPLEYKITGLSTDSTYYYRICSKQTRKISFFARAEASFSTQKAVGESFVFTIDADPHFDNNVNPDKVS